VYWCTFKSINNCQHLSTSRFSPLASKTEKNSLINDFKKMSGWFLNSDPYSWQIQGCRLLLCKPRSYLVSNIHAISIGFLCVLDTMKPFICVALCHELLLVEALHIIRFNHNVHCQSLIIQAEIFHGCDILIWLNFKLIQHNTNLKQKQQPV